MSSEPRSAPAEPMPHTAAPLIDAADAVILWNERRSRIADVTVARLPAYRLPAEHPSWALWRTLAGNWDYAFGAVSPLWLSSRTACPESVFAYFVMAEFAGAAEEARAFRAFAQIRECGWARDAQPDLLGWPRAATRAAAARAGRPAATVHLRVPRLPRTASQGAGAVSGWRGG